MELQEETFESRVLLDLSSIRLAHGDSRLTVDQVNVENTSDAMNGGSGTCRAACHKYKVVISVLRDTVDSDELADRSSSPLEKKMATVTLDADSWALCVKIQITSDFPTEAPLVIVRRKRNVEDAKPRERKGKSDRKKRERGELMTPTPADASAPAEIVETSARLTTEILNSPKEDRKQREKRFLADMFAFLCARLDPAKEEVELKEVAASGRRKSGSCPRKTSPDVEDREEEKRKGKGEKKPPMKTSTDVINRFIWDEAVQPARVSLCS